MEKENFYYLYKMNYNNKKFKIFWNDSIGIYPLEIVNGEQLTYPTLRDYLAIYMETMLKDNKVKDVLYMDGGDNDSSGDWFEDEFDEPKKCRFSFIPKVLKSAGVLVSAASVLAFFGYLYKSSADFQQNIDRITEALEEYPQREEERIEQAKQEQIEKNIQEAKERGTEIEYNPVLDMYFVKSDYDEENQKTTIYVNDLKQLRTYLPNENQNPTYEDVRNTLANNSEISDSNKEIINKVISNYENDLPNLDLFLLNYNISRMKVKDLGYSEFIPGKSAGTFASFNPWSAELKTYFKDMPLSTYAHELGHACFSLNMDIDESTKVVYIDYPVGYKPSMRLKTFYNANSEGIANLMGLAGADEKQYDSKLEGAYVPMTLGMNYALSIAGWTLEDYSNNGGYERLLEVLKEKGIEKPIEKLGRLSEIYDRYNPYAEYDPEAYSINEWCYDFVMEYGKSQIENGSQYDPGTIQDIFDNSAYTTVIQSYIEDILVDEYDQEATEKKVLEDLNTYHAEQQRENDDSRDK